MALWLSQQLPFILHTARGSDGNSVTDALFYLYNGRNS